MASKTYRGQNIEVYFDPKRCIHAAECVRGLVAVFNPERKPWILPDQAPVEDVVKVINRCPTGALQYQRTDGGLPESIPEVNEISIVPNGPLCGRGEMQLTDALGSQSTQTRVTLCRCGGSGIKPYCDGTHTKINFHDLGAVGSDPDLDVSLPPGVLEIVSVKDGPLALKGPVTLRAGSGRIAFRGDSTYLCRCGASGGKPFCDGSHTKIGFQDEQRVGESG